MTSFSPFSLVGADTVRTVLSTTGPVTKRDRLYQLDAAATEVARCQTVYRDLVRRVAQGNIHDVTTARIHAAAERLAAAMALQGEIEGILLDADQSLDMSQAEDRVTALQIALDRFDAVCPADREHVLTSHDYGISARAR
ncbi:hypothetical protein ASG40_11525 [Methylobacterium sp. Leaf399]|uniref:hypothetical protein n=1 Tax=Methylobacterium sp. Leaf399 TaxID=1736364 RepID=UPI000701818B|nr:hypothetical protein [Methylobacterium sp. Leaf399]KQT08504.1 hypothetical protein ASG40_11525 [Methylobacterium sp. Leaf399]